MDDLISRSALTDAIVDLLVFEWGYEGIEASVKRIFSEIPTVDAVEVVRCEKCLYRSQYPDENGDYKCGGLLTEDEELLLMVKPDFFCAYGERRGKDAVD